MSEGAGDDGRDTASGWSSPTLDLAVGVTDLALTVGARGAAQVRDVLGPISYAVAHRLAYPPLVPHDRAPGSVLAGLVRRGTRRREDTEAATLRTARRAIPVVADAVLDQLDLTSLVLARVDLATVVSVVLDQLDLTQLVLKRVALGEVVDAALDEVDLTAVVLERVDLHRVVMEVLDGLDLTALVRERVDLDALANEIIEDVDLPDIIRDSSSGVAADLVVEARTGAANADEAVARVIDRVLLRRRRRDGEPR